MTVLRKATPDGKRVIISLIGEDVEYVNPVEHFRKGQINLLSAQYRTMLAARDVAKTSMVPYSFFIEKAEESWNEIYENVMKADVPGNFIALLISGNKKEQERLMTGLSITPDQLGAFIFRAWNEFDFTMSTYHSEKLPKNIDEKSLPEMYVVEKDNVIKIGETSLSDKQLRAAVQDRKVIVARILDKHSEWHCFFQTYRSLRGEESWQDGQPHLHYLSNKWNIPRGQVVQQIQEGHYPATSVHIALTDYE